jgi:hypothetical protein
MAHCTPISGGLRESLVERQRKINCACSSLIEIGFLSDVFNINDIHENGYNDKDFIEFINPITSIANVAEVRNLYNTYKSACHNRFPPVHIHYSFSNLIDFIKWLNGSEQGKKAMASISIGISSENKNLPEKNEMTKTDVALAKMLVDYAASRKLDRKNIQNEIDELKKRQKDLEIEYSKIDVDLKSKLGPLYVYEEPSINKVKIEAYKLYEEDCKSKGITALPKVHEMGFQKAMEAFGEVVKERYFVKYLNDPARKVNIENHLKQRILLLEYVGGDKNDHSGDSYRNFVVADTSKDLNETAKFVYKFACDDSERGPVSKKARTVKQEGK